MKLADESDTGMLEELETNGLKIWHNQGMDLTVAVAELFKRFIAAGKVLF